ncbi:hypothetical protein [Streptomyces specialis]|uniref:hypothetical protein n=1 Tax=Streptomyces specialis TaxID=498367 RepID=UPI00389ABD1E
MNVRKSSTPDLVTAALAALFFAAAAVVGAVGYGGERLVLAWPPLFARWEPHTGPGTPAALVVAGLTVLYGPPLARRLPWRWVPVAAAGGSLAWIWSLALIDGWRPGIYGTLAYGHEYLTVMDRIGGIHDFLSTFTDHIPDGAPGQWPAHVAGHPPGATLTFVVLDRIGLAGGGWATAFCVTAAAGGAAAVLITVRALAGEELARRAAPFMVVAPAAVWLGVSADAWFTAGAARAVALLALAATRSVRAPRAAAFGSGLLFGLLLYLSYGLVLMGVVGLAVLYLAREWRPLPWLLLGVVPWAVAFTAAGFWWFDGYFTLVDRYYAGAGGHRPYAYFVWANLAVQVASVGLAAVAGLRRAALRRSWRGPLTVLVGSALCAMLLADVSGMSKAETERIWLPFAVWLLPAAALLPYRHARWWLAAQAVLAFCVNSLWLTRW